MGLGPVSLNKANLATQCLCISTVTAFVVLRFLVRFHLKQRLVLEDYSCLIAWVVTVAFCAIALTVGETWKGYPQANLKEEEIALITLYYWVLALLYGVAVLFVKIALLSILGRIFTSYPYLVYFLKTYMLVLCLYYVLLLFLKAFSCSPPSKFWEGRAEDGSCLGRRGIYLADAIFSVISDAIILMIPIPLAWRLQLPLRKKVQVAVILGAGGLAIAFSLYRVVLIAQNPHPEDKLYYFMQLVLTGNAELSLGLICACLPSVKICISLFFSS
ncbi:hypothetical protein BJX65DRAFT_226956 [Aspergillus insuetus]